jgi:phosphate-selective porin OprO and OprP
MNPNDQLATANGVAGGRLTAYTAALNWYVNRNVRFMFDFLHWDVAKQFSGTNPGDAGAASNALAMRTQVAFQPTPELAPHWSIETITNGNWRLSFA